MTAGFGIENRAYIVPGLADDKWQGDRRLDAAVSEAHPLWAEDIVSFGPWREVKDLPDGLGRGCLVSNLETAAPVFVCGPCGSSLDAVRGLDSLFAESGGLPPWATVLALSQQAGRGQLRRKWESPAGNIYAALRWPEPPGTPVGLTPVTVGLALCEAMGRAGLNVRMKWPNDILFGPNKVGGILVEEREGRVTAGIGVNLDSAPPVSALREGAAAPAGSLAALESGMKNIGPLTLWTRLLTDMMEMCAKDFFPKPHEEVARLAERRLAWLGWKVAVYNSDFDKLTGVIVGLAADGALRLSVGGRERILHSGSILPLP